MIAIMYSDTRDDGSFKNISVSYTIKKLLMTVVVITDLKQIHLAKSLYNMSLCLFACAEHRPFLWIEGLVNSFQQIFH